jgi:hypothetical protein
VKTAVLKFQGCKYFINKANKTIVFLFTILNLMTSYEVLLCGHHPQNMSYNSFVMCRLINFFTNSTSYNLQVFPIVDDSSRAKYNSLTSDPIILDNKVEHFTNFVNNAKKPTTDEKTKIVFMFATSENIFKLFNSLKQSIDKNVIVMNLIDFMYDNENIDIVNRIDTWSDHIFVLNKHWQDIYKPPILKKKPLLLKFNLDYITNSMNSVAGRLQARTDFGLNHDDFIIGNVHDNVTNSRLDITIRAFFYFMNKLKADKVNVDLSKIKCLITTSKTGAMDINEIITQNGMEYKDNFVIVQNLMTADLEKVLKLYNTVDMHINTSRTVYNNNVDKLMCWFHKPCICPNITTVKHDHILKHTELVDPEFYHYNHYMGGNSQGGILHAFKHETFGEKLYDVYNRLASLKPKYSKIGDKVKSHFKKMSSKEVPYLKKTFFDILNDSSLKDVITVSDDEEFNTNGFNSSSRVDDSVPVATRIEAIEERVATPAPAAVVPEVTAAVAVPEVTAAVATSSAIVYEVTAKDYQQLADQNALLTQMVQQQMELQKQMMAQMNKK